MNLTSKLLDMSLKGRSHTQVLYDHFGYPKNLPGREYPLIRALYKKAHPCGHPHWTTVREWARQQMMPF